MSSTSPTPQPPDSSTSTDNPVRQSPAAAPSIVSTTTNPGSRLLLLAVAIITAAALSIAAAHAPTRIRLLGLFPLAFGLLTAMIMIQIARSMNCRIGLLEVIVIGLTTFAGLIGSTWQSFRLEPVVKSKMEVHPIAAAVEAQIRKSGGTPPEDLEKSIIVIDDPVEQFQNYLGRRIRMLGDWNRPWPEIFWGCEVLLGTLGSVCLAFWLRRSEAPQ